MVLGRGDGWPCAASLAAIPGLSRPTIRCPLLLPYLKTLRKHIDMNRLLILALCVAAIGCGETAESESLKEARKLHDQLTRISGDLHDAMQASLASIETQIDEHMAQGDSALAIQLARVESQLSELDVRFHDWESTVVGIPGDACNHDHSHDHSHDHAHEGHDHDHAHDHAHDHGNELSLEGMSDDQIHEIQAALLAELQAIQAAYEAATAELNNSAASE